MKPVERYRAELNEIKAPDALKEKLLAIPTQYGETAQPIQADTTPAPVHTTERTTQGKKAIRFPALPKNWKKQALAAAACFAIGMLATDALDLQIIPKMSSNSTEMAMYDTMVTGSTSSSTSATSNSTTIVMQESAFEGSASLSDSSVDLSESTRTIANDTTAVDSDTSRKIIYTTSISLETMAYDDTIAALTNAVSEAGGYLETSELYGGSTYGTYERSSYFSYRIPAENYNSFLASVGESGSVTYQNESANDVTSTYLDLEARITTLTQQRDRLWELQTEAETLSDLLEIEATLTDVLYQIENYQSQLNYLADQVDYATVSVYLDEVIEYTITEPTVWETITRTFTGALTSFVATIGDIFLTILSLWVWIALALIGIFVYHGIKRKKAK